MATRISKVPPRVSSSSSGATAAEAAAVPPLTCFRPHPSINLPMTAVCSSGCGGHHRLLRQEHLLRRRVKGAPNVAPGRGWGRHPGRSPITFIGSSFVVAVDEGPLWTDGRTDGWKGGWTDGAACKFVFLLTRELFDHGRRPMGLISPWQTVDDAARLSLSDNVRPLCRRDWPFIWPSLIDADRRTNALAHPLTHRRTHSPTPPSPHPTHERSVSMPP